MASMCTPATCVHCIVVRHGNLATSNTPCTYCSAGTICTQPEQANMKVAEVLAKLHGTHVVDQAKYNTLVYDDIKSTFKPVNPYGYAKPDYGNRPKCPDGNSCKYLHFRKYHKDGTCKFDPCNKVQGLTSASVSAHFKTYNCHYDNKPTAAAAASPPQPTADSPRDVSKIQNLPLKVVQLKDLQGKCLGIREVQHKQIKTHEGHLWNYVLCGAPLTNWQTDKCDECTKCELADRDLTIQKIDLKIAELMELRQKTAKD